MRQQISGDVTRVIADLYCERMDIAVTRQLMQPESGKLDQGQEPGRTCLE